MYRKKPLVFDFQTFKLLPDTDNNLHLSSRVSIADSAGTLEFQAILSSTELTGIEHLSLATRQLQAEVLGGKLDLDFEFVANREQDEIIVTLPRKTTIEYQDSSGKIEELIKRYMPELQRSAQQESTAIVTMETSSRFVFQTGKKPSLEYTGEVKIKLDSVTSKVDLQSNDLQVNIADFSDPDSTSLNGNISINWVETAPFSYVLNGESAEPSTMLANEIDIQALLTLENSILVSTGKGRMMGAQTRSPVASTTGLDIAWQNLDLLNLTGKLSTRTQGFSTDFEDETWTGFDFDNTYDLLGNDKIRGSGILKFNDGPELPYEFTGNLQSNHWNITLPNSSIKLTELGSILRAAHYQLPESIKLTDGYIDISGEITVGDEITAVMSVRGHELAASMLETHAREAGFGFSTRYGKTISLDGPVSISALTLAGDIDVWDLHADMKVENTETFTLKNLHAEVFDGQVSLGSLRFSDSRIEDTTIEIQHIDLGRLLAYADIDGLEGTGQLDISLPAGSDQTGIYVRDGTFSSNSPGRLSYTKEGVAGSNIGLQALENFEYQDLSGTINYESSGAYLVAVRLEGKNPDLYGGHPIVFNLNINGLLPELFESLFITGDFEESILKQIRTD